MIDLIEALLLTMMVFIPIEFFFSLRRQTIFRHDFITDVMFVIFNAWPVKVGLLGFTLLGAWLASCLPFSCGALPYWVQVPLAILVSDMGVYWSHRLMHSSPTLWKFHAVHHSVEQMDFLAAVHQHPLDVLFLKGSALFPVVALGFSEAAVFTYVALFYWQSFFVHSNTRCSFGPLRYVFVSPEFHHWHHSSDVEARDKNYAAQFAFIDVLFGSLHLPKAMRPEVFGVDHPMPKGYFSLLIDPFKRLASR